MVRKTTKIKESSPALVDDARYNFAKSQTPSKSFALSILAIIIFSGWVYYNYNLSARLDKIEDAQILTQLKTIILLPDDVTPTMAVVTDAEVLKKQQPAFFANVKNGDRLIIYPELAIIYDYEVNKIIKIGPVQNAQLQSN